VLQVVNRLRPGRIILHNYTSNIIYNYISVHFHWLPVPNAFNSKS